MSNSNFVLSLPLVRLSYFDKLMCEDAITVTSLPLIFLLKGSSKRIKDFKLMKDSDFFTSWRTSNDSLPGRFESMIHSDSSISRINTLKVSEEWKGHNHTSVNKTFTLFKEKMKTNNLPTDFAIVKNDSLEKIGCFNDISDHERICLYNHIYIIIRYVFA